MANTYYDSQLDSEEIESVLEAINGVIDSANNGKILAIENGTIVPKNVSDYVDLNLQSKTVNPRASSQTVSPDEEYNGLSSVTVNGDANLAEGNIKKNISIFGVTGTYEGGNVLSGTGVPSESLGSDGDLYRRSFPLPQNITLYEYLQNNNGAYINTGIYATQDVDVIGTVDRSKGTGSAIGVRTGGWSGMTKAIYLGIHNDASNAISLIKTGTTSQSGSYSSVSGVSTRRTKTTVDPNGFYIYSSTIDELASYSKLYRQSGTWVSDMPILLFSFYQGTTLNIQTGTGAICRCTILDKNVPVADYIPCKDGNGVACMYDSVSGSFAYNDNADSNTYFSVGDIDNPAQLDDIYYVKKDGAWIALV